MQGTWDSGPFSGRVDSTQSLSLFVGDSGLGKSPLLYQLAISVAAGVDFLGRKVKQCRVLVMDFENSLEDVNKTIEGIGRALGLATLPENLRLWNVDDSPPFRPRNWSIILSRRY